MYEIKDILNMTNHDKYIVTNKTILNDKIYYMLINYDNLLDWVIVYEKDNELIEELDDKTITKICELFQKKGN